MKISYLALFKLIALLAILYFVYTPMSEPNISDELLDLSQLRLHKEEQAKSEKIVDIFNKGRKSKRRKKVVKPLRIAKMEPPSITIKTIFWGGNPVALIVTGSNEKLIKKGDSVKEFIVSQINKSSILFEKEGQTVEVYK